MYWTLAVRHLLVRPGRAVVLFTGYAIGVAVMIVLLSVGNAMLDQSRDASLMAGGELTVLPQGVDIEAMRTGGLTGMFFGINGSRFLSRQMLGGPRHRSLVTAVSPVLEQKLLEVRTRDTTWTVRAGGEIPSAATSAGAGLRIVAGSWNDGAADRAWTSPEPQGFYDEIDHFHSSPVRDSSWAEWHYFNVLVNEHEWWYITLLVSGDLRTPRSGGQVLVTHRLPNGTYQRFATNTGRDAIAFDTARADLVVGVSSVVQRDGIYRVRGASGGATFDLTLTPAAGRYFPPVELGDDHEASGYVVPALVGTASGRVCAAQACRDLHDVAAYHDHNWGSWRAVTWEWGAARSATHALLYGGVIAAGRISNSVPFFLALEDSLGVQQVYRFGGVERIGAQAIAGMPGISAPDSLRITASRRDDTLRITVKIVAVAASRSMAAGPDRVFVQMRGTWRAVGTAAGAVIADSGGGFFETWVRRGAK
jgi:hypothetical protein